MTPRKEELRFLVFLHTTKTQRREETLSHVPVFHSLAEVMRHRGIRSLNTFPTVLTKSGLAASAGFIFLRTIHACSFSQSSGVRGQPSRLFHSFFSVRCQ